jgi:uncharacterized protein (DUF885 family)
MTDTDDAATTGPRPPSDGEPPQGAPTGDARGELLRLAEEAWDAILAADPITATVVGDRRFDDRLRPNDPAGVERVRSTFRTLLARVEALPAAGLEPRDLVTAGALRSLLRQELDLRTADLERWVVDPLEGPQVLLLDLPSLQPTDTAAARGSMAERWAAAGPWLDQHRENLRAALGQGLVSPRSPIERVIDEVDRLLATPDEAWPMLDPVRAGVGSPEAVADTRLAERLATSIRDGIRPAFVRYRALLVDEILPSARSDIQPGLVAVPGGQAAYAAVTRAHTSLAMTPEAIHRIGLEEIARIDAELDEACRRVLGAADRHEGVRRLRSDPALHFRTAEEVRATAQQSLDRARAAIPAWFGILPRADCEVVEIPPHEAEHTTIAYYREPAADGSRPGRYYINTSHPQTRPRYEAEALAFHESVPGHHLQLAIAQERSGLPAFRRLAGSTAYIEGWGLYTERLSDEMGLYTDDLDRIGILSFDGWRASRLVVDTGMHALGWSRRRAIEFMAEHTALAVNNIANEVDRYISMPGQALAYKLGQLELLGLRADARERLGASFDIRRFHDRVLGEGALPLPVLHQVVEAWSGD